jgi:hypothetical protein
VKVKKECSSIYGFPEEQLASAFAMYALEDNQERFFTCPYITNNTQESVDYSDFKSFSFFGDIDSQPDVAKKIMSYIQNELTAKGLKYDEKNPDLIVKINYSFNKNPNFRPSQTQAIPKNRVDKSYAYRYDITKDKVQEFPFLPPGTLESDAAFTLKLGLKLEDQLIKPGRVIWECESTELLNETYSVQQFAAVNIPLMCMQFPYTKYSRNVQFRLSRKKFNYTGIRFNIDNIAEVESVEAYSPAAKAGIRPYDRIDAINDKELNKTVPQLSAVYRGFIKKTMNLRDEKTRFTDANGYPNCLYWDVLKYPKVMKEFDQKKNLTVFSYLFSYAPFINPTDNGQCVFRLRRDKEKLEFVIVPEVRISNSIAVE